MDKLVLRNNTSFIKNIQEVIKSFKFDKDDPLKPHQRIAHEYFLKYPHIRGLLIYWEMGSGKTMLAASICEVLVQKGTLRRVIFISSKTLHANFINDYKKYLKLSGSKLSDAEMEEHILSHCSLITLTANNMLQQVYRATSQGKGKVDIGEEFMDFPGFDISEETDNPKAKKINDLKRIKEEMEKLNITGNLDNVLLIIDEFHNLTNAITNGSQNAIGLYKLIMEAKNLKLLALTGNPIINHPFESAVCFNMLNGYFHTKSEDFSLFGDDYDTFNRLFIAHPETQEPEREATTEKGPGTERRLKIPSIKNKDKFSNRIVGLVSYYGIQESEIRDLFPKTNELIIQRTPMSIPQYSAYASARDREQEESRRGVFHGKKVPLTKPQGASSSYRIRSRQISNFFYPESATISFKDEKGLVKVERDLNKLGEEALSIEGLRIYSPKALQLLVNVSIHLPAHILKPFKKLADSDPALKPELFKRKIKPGIGPGIIYSQFLDCGVEVIARILEYYGMKRLDLTDTIGGAKKETKKESEETNQGTFAVVSGEVESEIRSEIVKLSQSPDNKKGQLLTLLLITGTGAEGISTKYMRHVHAYEPFWHRSRLDQIFARAVRLGSHMDLPPEERNVQPYLYLADYPTAFEDEEFLKMKSTEDTTDITLYYMALQNHILNMSFLRTFREASFDCLNHYKKNCKVCQPTNVPLFLENLTKDMASPSPCQSPREEKIKAKSIIVEDEHGKREYMYSYDSSGILHIFAFQPNLGAYQEIFDDHPDFDVLFRKIQKLKKSK